MFRKTISKSNVYISIISSLLFVLPVLFYSQAIGAEQAEAGISILKVSSEGITVQFSPPRGSSGTLEAQLHELDGKLLAKVTRQHKGKPIEVELFGQINEKDLGNYYLRYRFSSGAEFQQRSLLFAGEILETTVLGQREFVAGTQPLIRVLVKDHSAGVPIQGATVSAELLEQDKTISKFTAKTDKYGEAAAKLQMPDSPMNNLKLKILVTTKTSKDTIEETVQVRSSLRTLLTTDKPLYQPGQTIHIRSLTLSGAEMKPLSEAQVVFEVEDSKGNKVFKASRKTDEYGIGFTDFVLADELNMGTYRVRAIVAGVKEEKTVNIERYVLPKFKINFKSDRNFYQPGETVKGEIQVDYFFGKPVALGKVQINCAKFDVEYTDFQTIEGKTDDKGHYAFEVKLPEHFIGQPLEAGKASAKFEIKVTDTADHKETITKNISVTASPIIIAAVPESGELTPGLENKIYIVTTYADSKPAKCKVTWQNAPAGKPVVIEIDEAGFGEVTLKPQEGQTIHLTLTAKDTQGSSGRAEVELKVKEKIDDDWILLRTDKSLYRTGEQVELSVFTTRKTGTVYIDLIKDKQTNLTKTLELKSGKTSDKLTLDASLAGTIQLNAYLIGKNGVIVRDQRLLLVDPADDLSISITSDSESYLPGGNANLKFKVTNKKGKGTASALGVMVVDEAVFALQEMQPGLEKVYFYLEKEIATPRYEIHGYELDQCIMPPPPDVDIRAEQKQRDTAAKVLLASAKGVGEYSLNVNTYKRDNRAQMFLQKMSPLMSSRYQKIQEALNKFSQDHRKLLQKRFKDGATLDTLVKEGYCKQADILDPWDVAMKINGQWSEQDQTYSWWFLSSAGIDGKWDTADDFSAQWNYVFEGKDKKDFDSALLRFGRLDEFEMNGDMRRGGFALGGARERVLLQDEGVALAMVAAKPEVPALAVGSTFTAAEPVRIRQYFPETLYFNPALITDGQGFAALNVPLADSITTWRLTCMASSAAGLLGSTTSGIRVFQDFFVDIDFPVSLTQNDRINVPVAIYNYLKTDQKILLEVKKEDWFKLEGLPEKTVTVAPSEVTAVYFPIIAKKVGFQTFTITARGTSKSDAVARSVEIIPDGKENIWSESGRLQENITHSITIPENAIDDASRIFVKIYPGVLSQVIEGLDKMLQMPFGCFEQTSSVTYPNILVLDYMKTTGKITPELQMKAEGFINSGYQRLVSYEVPGGGFEWFGKAPAHRILTAYGLMEFYDMSKVYEVDPAIIARTQQWLAKCQEADGSYKPSAGGIAEGAINKFTDDVLRNTAYITWALASTGYDGPEMKKGIEYLHNHLDDMKDVYTRALVVNALATVAPDDKITLDTLRALHDMRTEKDDMVYWQSQSETPTCGTGKAADIEVTALAVQAFIRCGQEFGTVSKAITFLVKKKDAYGTWQSTQATIQALRAMLMAERGATAKTTANITVKFNGDEVSQIKVDETNSDVLQLVDLKDRTRKGENTVQLQFEGKGALLYQVVGRFYVPYPEKIKPGEKEPMTIDIKYDRTQLATDDIINVTATVRNNRPGTAKMIIVDLGLPPGFTLIPDNLNKLVDKQIIEKYSTTGRQIIIYLREVTNKKPVEIQYQLLAKYPLKVKTLNSTVYEYYNPDVKAESKPVELVVAGKEK